VGRRCCSDSGDDLDPGLVHRLEPRSLLLRILVWDGADDVVPPAVLVDLALAAPFPPAGLMPRLLKSNAMLRNSRPSGLG